MTSMNKRIVLNLYRNTLKAARAYGKSAEMKQMAAMEEVASFNKDLKMQMIATRNSLNRGVMTSALAQFMTRRMFQTGKFASSQDSEHFVGDAIAAYKKLNQKVTIFDQLPTILGCEQMVNGIKIEANSRFVGRVPSSGKYRYQLNIRFTNQTSQTLQLLSEHLYTKDEQLNETNRESGLMALHQKIPLPLKVSGVYEHTTLFSLPTELGFCKCEYAFADVQTGALVRAPVPPLLLSTHDPDTDYRQNCYRGDPQKDIEVVAKLRQPDSDKLEVLDQSPPHHDDGEGKEWMRISADDDETLNDNVETEVRTGWKQPARSSLNFQELDHEENDDDLATVHRGQKAPQRG